MMIYCEIPAENPVCGPVLQAPVIENTPVILNTQVLSNRRKRDTSTSNTTVLPQDVLLLIVNTANASDAVNYVSILSSI